MDRLENCNFVSKLILTKVVFSTSKNLANEIWRISFSGFKL